MSETLQILTSCDAPGCLALSTRACERYGPVPYGLPDGWIQIADRDKLLTICPRHKVDSVWYLDGSVLDV